jgi:hypothetical protein
MVVFSNHRLGPSAELLVSREVAVEILREVAAAAGPRARARWEHELVTWLERLANDQAPAVDERSEAIGGGYPAGSPGRAADRVPRGIDVSDIAWTPEHFERQRGFLIEAIRSVIESSRNARALARWAGMIEAHPRESVQVGRRWQWPISQVTT